MPRQDGDAQAGGDRLLDRLVALDGHLRPEAPAALSEVLLDGQARAGARFAAEKGLRRQLLPAQALTREAVTGRGDHHQRVVGQRHHVQVQMPRRLAEYIEVVAVVLQTADHLRAVGDIQLHLDLRVLPAERAEQARHQVLGGGHRAEAQLPGGQAVELGQAHLQMIEGIEDLPRPGLHLAPGIGQVQALAQLLEQVHAQGLLQLGDLRRHRGLCQVQGARRLRHAEALGHGEEGFQLAKGGLAGVKARSFHSQ